MRSRELHKRLAVLEKALAPPPRIIWSPWQRVLDDDVYGLVLALAARKARPGGDPGDVGTWCNDFPAWAALCRDDRERELLRRIEAVAAASPEPCRGHWRGELWQHLMDLQL
jgi:hypothetical protein